MTVLTLRALKLIALGAALAVPSLASANVLPLQFETSASAVANLDPLNGGEFSVFDGGLNTVSASVGFTGINGGQQTTNSASASLSTGEVKLFTQCAIHQNCTASASWEDTLIFDLSALPFGSTIDVRFLAQIDGTYGDSTQPNFRFDALSTWTALQAGVGYRTSQAIDDVSSPELLLEFARNGNFITFGPNIFDGLLPLDTGYLHHVSVSMSVSGDTNVDFSNTATIAVSSPVPYTSASGVFLTESTNPAPVPVPAVLPVFLLAAGTVAALRKTRGS